MIQRLPFLFLLLWVVQACPTRPTSPVRNPPNPPLPAPAAQTDSSIRFLAGYPATLLYALDAVAGERNRAAGYRQWLVGDERVPWLDAYAERRRGWGAAMRPDHGGGAPAFEVCGWETDEIEQAIRCIEGVVPAAERAVAVTAIREADSRLRPKWPELSRHMTAMLPELEEELRTTRAAGLFRTLRSEAGLVENVPLRFNVVLVAKPPGSRSFARQAGQFLVHEVSPDETVGGLLAIAFHEIAHLAHFMSPRREEMERAFLRHGDRGRIAANIWDEVVATAFGNGLAAEQIDPAFRIDRSFYSDRWVDNVGRALYREWKAAPSVRLGPELATRLVQLTDREWPEDQRPMSRYLWGVTIHAQDRALSRELLRGVDYRSASRMSPIDDAVPSGPELPPWAPRIVLMTVDELSRRPALVARAGIPPTSWEAALSGNDGAVFRHDDADGALILVIVARSADALRTAAHAFARLPRMVAAGWTPISAPG